jgi:hypothetical protein
MLRLPNVQLRQTGNTCAVDQPHSASDRSTISCVPDGADLRVVTPAQDGPLAHNSSKNEKQRRRLTSHLGSNLEHTADFVPVLATDIFHSKWGISTSENVLEAAFFY